MARLSVNEAAYGWTHKFYFDYLDLQASGFLSTLGAANQKIVGTLNPGGVMKDAALILVTAAAGATDLTIDFGVTSADPDDFLDNGDVDGMTKIIYNTGDQFIGTDSGTQTTANVINGYVNNTTSAKPLYMEFNGTLSSLTAGKWVLAWRQMDAPATTG